MLNAMHVENLDICLISVGKAISSVLAKQFKGTMLHVMRLDILLSSIEL